MNDSFFLPLNSYKRELNAAPPLCYLAYTTKQAQLVWQRITNIVFCLCLDGNAAARRFTVNGYPFEADFPYLRIKHPGEIHESKKEAELYSCIYFAYEPEHVEALRRIGLPDDLCIHMLPELPEISGILRKIQNRVPLSGEFGVADRLDMFALELVQCMLLACRKKTEIPKAGEEKIRRIISWLQFHFREPLNWENIARKNAYSYRTFLRLWKSCGYPLPREYLAELRMEEAKRLLAETSLPITDIADLLHYNSSAWFCAVFRGKTGETPLSYRRRLQGK